MQDLSDYRAPIGEDQLGTATSKFAHPNQPFRLQNPDNSAQVSIACLKQECFLRTVEFVGRAIASTGFHER
jgi:hypothetical protein